MTLTNNEYFKSLFKAAIPDQGDVSQEVIADIMTKCSQQFRETRDQLNQGKSSNTWQPKNALIFQF